MKKLALAALAAASMALSACTALGAIGAATSIAASTADAAGVPAPATYADKTRLDERAGIAIEVAYNAWYRLLELAIDAGFVQPSQAARLAAIDNRAYGATLAAQRAYLAGNATSFRAAEAEARAAIREGMLLLPAKGN